MAIIRQNVNSTSIVDGSVSSADLASIIDLSSKTVTYGNLPAANLTGTLPAIDGSALTGIESLPTAISVDGSAPDNSLNINSSGNVGIGTSSPSVLLHLKGSSFSSAIRWEETGGNNNFYIGPFNTSGDFGIDNNSTSGIIRLVTNSIERMRIDSVGNVGIGTTSPTNFGSTFKMFAVEGSSYGVMQSRSTSGSVITEIMASPSLGLIGTRSNHPLVLRTNDTERVRIDGTDFKFNSGYGSVATAYGCRAWVNFSMSGTWSIRGDGNVSSVTDRGTGRGTVNFTTAMPDGNYAVTMGSYYYDVDNSSSQMNAGAYDLQTTNFDFALSDASGNAYQDPLYVYFSVFR